MYFLDELNRWMDDHSDPQVVWYLKRLTANDTVAGGSNQAGPYIPRDFLLEVFPQLNRRDVRNPDLRFPLQIDSVAEPLSPIEVRAVWYNNQFFGGTRNETRMTGFGGAESPLLNPDSTGALAVFAFHRTDDGKPARCFVWICRHDLDEDVIESRVGAVQPGEWRMWTTGPAPAIAADLRGAGCWLQPDEIPREWLEQFPGGEEIIQRAVEAGPPLTHDMDKRMMTRRVCEFQIFQSLEEAVELPVIRAGFDSIESFVSRAQSILQRRKSRSGRSLELHARVIFREEGLVEGTDFEFQPKIEGGKAPDYLFPGAAAYDDAGFPVERLRLLAVKTSCKDRWRQVLNEANRIQDKHLLTLQEGVSENQFREMREANLRLVVPRPLHTSYPSAVRTELMSLAEFVDEVKSLRS